MRFCVICNYLSKIIPAVQSRCTRFRFAPLVEEQIMPRLNFVIDQERLLGCSEDGKRALIALSGGDMRKVLNVLQSTWMAYKEVTETTVYRCVGHPQQLDIETMVGWLLNTGDYKECYDREWFHGVGAGWSTELMVVYCCICRDSKDEDRQGFGVGGHFA